MRRENKECGAAVLFFLSALLPLLLLAGVLALDLEHDRIAYESAVQDADRGAITRQLSSLERYFGNLADKNVHWPGITHATALYVPHSPFARVMLNRNDVERSVSVSSSARITPLTTTLIISTQGMSLEELSLLKGELFNIWNQFEQIPEVSFELAAVHTDNLLRLTNSSYRSLLSRDEKVATRNLLLAQELSAPVAAALKDEALWRIVRNLIFSTSHARHTRHLVIYISHDDPLQLLTRSPLEMLQKSGLCSDNALAYDIVNIQLSAAKYTRLWFDRHICVNGKVVVTGLEVASLRPGMINEAVTTVFKSVAKVEVIR